jgi:enoyl-CoA hydratase/carnithine racemase
MIESIRHGSVLQLQLARAPVNALNSELLGALRDAVRDAPSQGAEALILSGGPSVFCAGLDVPYLLTLGGEALQAAWELFFDAARALAESPIPVVAAIDGHSPAGGCVLALCCDYRIMARGDFRIGLNEVQVGLPVPDAVQYLLQRTIGRLPAERLMLVGAMLDAQAAHAVGMVDALVDSGDVVAAARQWLDKVLALPRLAMLETRRYARSDLIEALSSPERIGIAHFLDIWTRTETQTMLHAMVARLKARKG